MNREVYLSLLILISMGEIWMCWRLLKGGFADKRVSGHWKRLIKWGCIFLCGTVLGISREVYFFSAVTFLACIVVISGCACRVMNITFRTGFALTGAYYSLLSFFDLFLCFLYMEKEAGLSPEAISVDALVEERLLIYILSRMWTLILLLLSERLLQGIGKKLSSYQNEACVCLVVIYLLLIRYQLILEDTTFGSRGIRGITESISIAVLPALFMTGGVLFFRYQLLKKETELLQIHEQMMEKQFQDMYRSRQTVHDMKNHILLMRKYVEEGRIEELHQYLGELGTEMGANSGQILTGIEEIDFMIDQKGREAKALGIEMEIDVPLLKSMPVSPKEAVSLFGNLLDNALEACKRSGDEEKWIRLTIRISHQILLLKIENSKGKIEKEDSAGLSSSKTGTGIHGYGLRNVCQIVERHKGEIAIQDQEDTFCVRILFFSQGGIV